MNLLVTNHAQVLACVTRDPEVRLREVAESVGLTERAVQRLVGELEAAGFLQRVREGRRNRYQVAAEPLRKLARSLYALAPGGPALEVVGEPARVQPSLGPASAQADVPFAPLAGDGISRNLSFID